MIAIIDYGMGNLRSVQKALESIGTNAIITEDIKVIEKSSGIILPGVGAFPDAMKNLADKNLITPIIDSVNGKKPLLGICLGMQLLFEYGEEIRYCKGLGIMEGYIKRLKGDVKIPHMGWNNLKLVKGCGILQGTFENEFAYFVHSYYTELQNSELLNAYADYGLKVPAVVSSGNTFGVQFHPEKSGECGIRILRNFINIVNGGQEREDDSYSSY